MNAFEQLESYLKSLEKRLRLMAITRGAALTAAAALIATLVLVLILNSLAFSEGSVTFGRFMLFLALAFALGFGVIAPLLRLNSRRAAGSAESQAPQFEQRLMTFAERKESPEKDPFLELLAADTLKVAREAEPARLIPAGKLAGFAGLAVVAAGLLYWLTQAPGYMGHGASLLWAGTPKEAQPFYSITVTPGDRRVRRRTDQLVTAQLMGFQTDRVRLMAQYKGTSKWEEVQMTPQPSGAGYEFLLAGLPETVTYYVQAGSIKSREHKLTVVDLPGIKKIKVAYKYPNWAGLREVSEEGGGDLRAVAGTEATVSILTDKPLADGMLVIDNQTKIKLEAGEGGWMKGRIQMDKDGIYHIAAVDQGEQVRLSDDFFIEARQAMEPVVKISRPRGDARVSPIEEVSIEVDAEDDFGLNAVTLHYSVNGGQEKTVNVLPKPGMTSVQGKTMIAMEEFKLVPGDVVSVYATARDASQTARTDMVFIQAEPFEREYSQSQQMGGGGGGGEMEDQNKISQRQKEIIAATWNQIRDTSGNRAAASENARFLSEVQGKLRDQATSLARRMRSRELAGTNNEFRSFAQDMEKASVAMGTAVDKLKSQGWKDAMPHEQKALQHILRAEATFRQIQVAFGQQGGGGGGGGGGRDLASLFDLELDTEKNQYETSRSAGQSEEQRQKDVDEALQKLEQLARRQKELAEQARNQQKNTPQQRWQQEMLRREAEQLQKQLEQMNGQQGQQGQQGPQSSQTSSSSSSSGQQGQQGQQSQQQQQQQMARNQQQQQRGRQGNIDPRVERALERLRQATEDMRRGGQEQSDASSRRAAERLEEARNMLNSMRQQQATGTAGDLARRAEQLADKQHQLQDQLKNMYGQGTGNPNELRNALRNQEQAQQLAQQKEQMLRDLQKLEQDMQRAARDMAGTNRSASSKIREALGEMQGKEIGTRMRLGAEWLKRGYGSATYMREQPITEGLDKLKEQLKDAQGQVDQNGAGQQAGNELERALSQVERLRAQLQRQSQGQRGNQQGNQQGQQRGQGQQGQQGQQAGQQGQQGQGGQQGKGQQAGNQQGGGQRGGQPGQGEASGDGRMPQPGRRQGSGDRFGDTGYSAMNRGTGDLVGPEGPMPMPADGGRGLETAYREGMRDLNQMRMQVAESDTESAREIAEMIRQMQRIDPSKFPGNPQLLERMRAEVLPNLEQLEIQLRRRLEEKQGGQVRSAASDPVPAGYADAVAEYFRKLSKGR
jgi:hypothetical protein